MGLLSYGVQVLIGRVAGKSQQGESVEIEEGGRAPLLHGPRDMGVYEANTVRALKEHLHRLGLLPTPWTEIEAVLVTDVDEYLRLWNQSN